MNNIDELREEVEALRAEKKALRADKGFYELLDDDLKLKADVTALLTQLPESAK